jgi:hypothetical protein
VSLLISQVPRNNRTFVRYLPPRKRPPKNRRLRGIQTFFCAFVRRICPNFIGIGGRPQKLACRESDVRAKSDVRPKKVLRAGQKNGTAAAIPFPFVRDFSVFRTFVQCVRSEKMRKLGRSYDCRYALTDIHLKLRGCPTDSTVLWTVAECFHNATVPTRFRRLSNGRVSRSPRRRRP